MSDRPLLVAAAGALACALVATVTAVVTGDGSGAAGTASPAAGSPPPAQTPMDATPSKTGPVLDSNFPDPEVLKAGGTYYAYATNDGDKNVPVATASSPMGPWSRSGADALPALPAWAEPGRTWAPDVSARSDGTYLLYFTATRRGTDRQCIGAATSRSPTGPFAPDGAGPLVCRDDGDTIDPASFVDTDGTRYVLYKQGGNPVGSLYLQRTTLDGMRPQGAPVRILSKGDDEPTLIEAPALVKRDGRYVLFYAAGVFYRSDYQTRYATASSITGPYTKAARPLLTTEGYHKEITGPGGADVVHDGADAHLVFHGITRFLGGNGVTRGMYVAELGWADGTPVVRGSPVRYEAESGRVFGGRVLRGMAGLSGGSAVGYLDNAQSLVDLDVYAPVAGDYVARVHYANRSDGPAEHILTVNGAAPVSVHYPPDPAHKWRDLTVEVGLRAGWNVLRLAYQSGHAELDCIEVS